MHPTTAIFRRELQSFFRSPVAYVFLVVFLLLTGFLTFYVRHLFEEGRASLDAFFFWFPWVYLLLVPAAAMRLWSEERRTHTIELLLTLPVTPAQAIAGKYFAALAFLAAGLTLTFPMVLTVAWLGDPDPGPIVSGYLGALLLAGAYLAVGVCTSAMTRNQVISFVLTLTVCLLLLLAGWPPVHDLFSRWAPDWLVGAVAAVGFMPHYDQLVRGVVDVRDVLYFVTMPAVFLFGAFLVLDNRRAS